MAGNHAHMPGEGGYEKRDIRVRPLVIAGTIFLTSWILVFALALGVFRYFGHRAAQLSVPPNLLEQMYGRQVPPEPRLQTDPLRDLHALRAAEAAALDSYGWVDRSAGIVHIPIDRAIELLAQRGLPARPPAGEPAPAAPAGAPGGAAPVVSQAPPPPASGSAP